MPPFQAGAGRQFPLGILGSPAYLFIVKAKITYWRESDGNYLGYLNEYPDHWTQGEDLDDLKKHLRDLFSLFNQESIPGIRKEEELEIA
jgi:predicted RNase H-like HicB family nuclease